MPEQETVFSSKMKYVGLLNFKEYYQFCHDWLVQEIDTKLMETKYEEKIKQDGKDINIKWIAKAKITDYFRYVIEVKFRILRMKDVEVIKDGIKIKMQDASVEIKVKGDLQRDYEGKFERTAWRKFLRGIYEKWIIKPRIEQYEDKLIYKCDEFLTQAKAWLDIEGNRDDLIGVE